MTNILVEYKMESKANQTRFEINIKNKSIFLVAFIEYI